MQLKGKNTVEDLLSAEDLIKYKEWLYPFNISILDKALKAKLKEDPDYEVWVPLIYFKCRQFVKKADSPLYLEPWATYISNKGDIISALDTSKGVLSKILIKGYYYTPITRNRKQDNYLIHRALACCFVPLPDNFGGLHPLDLQVNHKDGIKTNLELDNLEWMTPLENTHHAIETGLIKGRTKRTVM